MPYASAGFLRHNLDLFSRSNDVLKYLDHNYDLFYTITDFKDNKIHIQFELQELELFEGTNHGYSIDDLGICEVTVNPENDIYVDWLSVEEKHQRKGIAYFLLYVVSLFAKDKLCYRMLLCDASEQTRSDKHIYKRLCLEHVDYNKSLKHVHSRRSNRLNDEIMMAGNLDEVISRLEGNDPCKIDFEIKTFINPETFKNMIKSGIKREEKSKSIVIPLSEERKNEISRLEQEVNMPESKKSKKAGSKKKKKRSFRRHLSKRRVSRKRRSKRHRTKRHRTKRRSTRRNTPKKQ